MDAVNINIEELEHLLRQAGNLFQDRTAAGQVQTKGIADYSTSWQLNLLLQLYLFLLLFLSRLSLQTQFYQVRMIF